MLVAAVLVIAVLCAYWPVKSFGYLRIDDNEYVLQPDMVKRGLTAEGIRWAFTTMSVANWHPLTWLSYMLDISVFGINSPGAVHIENVALHAANSVLLLLVLSSMTGAWWRSAVVAGLFALHPIHVESVAWIAERKDVLSTFFGLIAMATYVGYARRSAPVRYVLLLGAYSLSLMSKPMLVTLPFLLLVLDYWPLQRATRESQDQRQFPIVSPARLVWEKAPLFGLAACSSVITYIAQSRLGAVATEQQLPLASRMANAIVSYARYIAKTAWPRDLAFHYPHPATWPWQAVAGCGLLLTIINVFVLWSARRRPFLLAGWLWFLGTLVPVIGLIQAGGQAMADRYMYLPSVGLFIMLAWTVGAMCTSRRAMVIAMIVATSVLAALGMATHRQVMFWRNGETLFSRSLDVTNDNWFMEYTLGLEFSDRDAFAEAIEHFQKSARLRPGDPEVQVHRADVLLLLGRVDEAIDAYRIVLSLNDRHVNALNNYACILAASSEPRHRNGELAVRLAQRACELTNHQHAGNLFTLAAAYAETARFDLATVTAQQALELAWSSGQTRLAESIRAKIELFRAGQPSREFYQNRMNAGEPAPTDNGARTSDH